MSDPIQTSLEIIPAIANKEEENPVRRDPFGILPDTIPGRILWAVFLKTIALGAGPKASNINDLPGLVTKFGQLPDDLIKATYVANHLALVGGAIANALKFCSFDWKNDLERRFVSARFGQWIQEIRAELSYRGMVNSLRGELILASEPDCRHGFACAHEAAIDLGVEIYRQFWSRIDPVHSCDIDGDPNVKLDIPIICKVLPEVQQIFRQRTWPDGNAIGRSCQIEAHRAARRREEVLGATSQNIKGTVRPSGGKKKPGRPMQTDPQSDKRIAEAWKTKHYRTYADLGRELGMSVADVANALERHRHRTGRK